MVYIIVEPIHFESYGLFFFFNEHVDISDEMTGYSVACIVYCEADRFSGRNTVGMCSRIGANARWNEVLYMICEVVVIRDEEVGGRCVARGYRADAPRQSL